MTAAEMRPFSQSLPMALLRAREAAMRRFRPMLAEHDLTEQQWRVLRALAASDDPTSVGEVAEHTFLLGPSLSRILANLERRHLVERHTNENDQRSALLTLSGAGRALVGRIAPRSEEIYNGIEAEFGAGRLAALLDELATLSSIDAAGDLEEAS